MKQEGKIIGVSGKQITLSLTDDFDISAAKRLSNGSMRVEFEVLDVRAMTQAQNGMIHGLFTDMSDYTGYPAEWVKSLLKAMFSGYKGIEDFSMQKNKTSQVFAGEFIEYILDFFFKEQIPFKYQKFHLGGDITRILFIYLKHRACFVCGKHHADIAHYEAVGSGRNRKKIDHSQHRFMALCREHHNEQHQIGIETFMTKHVLVPIKLSPEQIKEFKIG